MSNSIRLAVGYGQEQIVSDLWELRNLEGESDEEEDAEEKGKVDPICLGTFYLDVTLTALELGSGWWVTKRERGRE